MAKVARRGRSWAVTHSVTGKVLYRFYGRGAKARALAKRREVVRRNFPRRR